MQTALPVLVSLAVLGVALVGARVDLPWLPGCWFSRHTGLLCAGCGLTRGFFAIMRLELAEAWRPNPFSLPVFGLVLATALEPLVPLREWIAPRWRGPMAMAFALTWIGWGLWRMVTMG